MNILTATTAIFKAARENNHRAVLLEVLLTLIKEPKTTLDVQKSTGLKYGASVQAVKDLRKFGLVKEHSKSEEKTGNNQPMSRYTLTKDGELEAAKLLTKVKTNFNKL